MPVRGVSRSGKEEGKQKIEEQMERKQTCARCRFSWHTEALLARFPGEVGLLKEYWTVGVSGRFR